MTLVIAHRGASLARPENTIPAFQEARRLGADMVELDARRTADGALVVQHDPAVAGSAPLVTQRRADVNTSVPDLSAAIDACLPMQVNVEVKNFPNEPDWDETDMVAAGVVALIGERSLHGAVLISSFNLRSIDRARELDGRVRTAFLTLPGWDQRDAIETCATRGHEAIHPHDSAVTAELVAAAHAAGVRVNVWTVDDPSRIAELAAWGVDGVCTNAPDVALRVLGRPVPD